MQERRRNLSSHFVIVLALLGHVLQHALAGDIISAYAGVGGSGTSGGDGGQATAAVINQPNFNWINSNGNFYVTEAGVGKVRSVSTSGIITTYFGKGTTTVNGGNGGAATAASALPYGIFGDTNGGGTLSNTNSADEGAAATAADFSTSSGCVVLDTNGNLYFLANPYHKIKTVKLTTMKLTTMAGTGSGAANDNAANMGNDGQATSARIYAPYGGCVDTNAALYVTSAGGGYIRKIDLTSGIISLIAGGSGSQGYAGNYAPATATSTLLQGGVVTFVATDSVGNIYYSAYTYNNIRYVDTNGIIGPYAGTSSPSGSFTGNGGDATSATFSGPRSMSCRGDYVYVNDLSNYQVRKIGVASTTVGGTTTASSTSPSIVPSVAPTLVPTSEPSLGPSLMPSTSPSVTPTVVPSISPSIMPTINPSRAPTLLPSVAPTLAPTLKPTVSPSIVPSVGPSVVPSTPPTGSPTLTMTPTIAPSLAPSVTPTFAPSLAPSLIPTVAPTVVPTVTPTSLPSVAPTIVPTVKPTIAPTVEPTVVPTVEPTNCPSVVPTDMPTVIPSMAPSFEPSLPPTLAPSEVPTLSPTNGPTVVPSLAPSASPTISPTLLPSVVPTNTPSEVPTVAPTVAPSVVPSILPSVGPSVMPSVVPSVRPSLAPIGPTIAPTHRPTTASPSFTPTLDYVDISFDTNIYLHNVSVTVLDEPCQNAVVAAVADTLDVDNSQVTFLSQEFIGVENGINVRRRRMLATESYQLLVRVNVWASTRNYEDTTNKNGSFLYHKLSNTLIQSVNSNEFAATVRAVSVSLNAIGTLYVGNVNLTVTEYTVITPTDDTVHSSESDDTLTRGAYIGIIIGGIAFILLIAGCCFYVFGGFAPKNNHANDTSIVVPAASVPVSTEDVVDREQNVMKL